MCAQNVIRVRVGLVCFPSQCQSYPPPANLCLNCETTPRGIQTKGKFRSRNFLANQYGGFISILIITFKSGNFCTQKSTDVLIREGFKPLFLIVLVYKKLETSAPSQPAAIVFYCSYSSFPLNHLGLGSAP